MSTAEANELGDVLNLVKNWPSGLRITLARRILESVESHPVGAPPDILETDATPWTKTPRGVPVESVVGLLRNDQAPPSDEECRRIVEEDRWRKYGSSTY